MLSGLQRVRMLVSVKNLLHRVHISLSLWDAAGVHLATSPNHYHKGEPKESAGTLCTPYWVPLDVTGDILCEGQKQTTQQKQADIDKCRRAGLIIGALREFSGKMPPRYLAEPSDPIRP